MRFSAGMPTLATLLVVLLPRTTAVEDQGPTCTGGLSGIENDTEGTCCPVGCGQCGGTDCASNGLPDYNKYDCCADRILASEVYCDTPGASAPCIIVSATPAPAPSLGPTCTGGLSGIENDTEGTCCPVGCGQCGGTDCASNGLPDYNKYDCCAGRILASEVYCDTPGASAPCIIVSATPAPIGGGPTPAPTNAPTSAPTGGGLTPAPTKAPTPAPAPTSSSIFTELVDLGVPEIIATAMIANATGGFAGPGSLTTTPSTIELDLQDSGAFSLSGTFVRDGGAALPSSTTVFLYIDNSGDPSDFIRGQDDVNPSTGTFETVVTDIPAGDSTLYASVVVVDPAEALDDAGMDTVFALDISNSAECDPSLTLTLEWSDAYADLDLYVTEPDGTFVSWGNTEGGVGFLDNDDLEGFGPENYVIYSGLDTATSPVLGVYEVFVSLYVGSSEWWRLTARASGEVVWVEEGSYADVRGTSSSYGTYEYASDTFTYTVAEYDPRCGGVA